MTNYTITNIGTVAGGLGIDKLTYIYTYDQGGVWTSNWSEDANGSYGGGQMLSFTVTFDENVTVTGTDSVLGLTIGSTAREAATSPATIQASLRAS